MKRIKLKADYYSSLGDDFAVRAEIRKFRDIKLAVLNEKLAEELGIDDETIRESAFDSFETVCPAAMAYSGHQFGYYTNLGDGRAILLGELEKGGRLIDIHTKGSGETAFSRRGDGLATLESNLREFLISRFMNEMGIPTSRGLAVFKTGESVYRNAGSPGSVLVRTSRSMIRVGTFQYAREKFGKEGVKRLACYAMKRLYPYDEGADISEFVQRVVISQAQLIAMWMGVGFVHGVMNTDNVSVAGETIDYGPCAFMDHYYEARRFSSIDKFGRYAYGNQPAVGKWNMERFVELFEGLLSEHALQEALNSYDYAFTLAFRDVFMRKLGFERSEEKDFDLIDEFLNAMETYHYDFTGTFVDISLGNADKYKGLGPFEEKRKALLKKRGISESEAVGIMKKANPVLIPRNAVLNEALDRASRGDFDLFNRMYEAVSDPFNYDERLCAELIAVPSIEEDLSHTTYCGT